MPTMKHLPQIAFFTVVFGLSGPALAQQPNGPPVLVPAGAPACESMAEALLTAARHDADEEFWLQVAVLLNEPSRNLPAGLKLAWQERRKALAVAWEQHAARLKVCAALGHGPYDPRLRDYDFSADVSATYHPLIVGSTYVYERMSAGGLERVETTVQDQVDLIARIPCRVVLTVETLDGVLVERTTDWFSQHADGTVWYLGENSQEYAEGMIVSLEGSWRMGVSGAKPGILMLSSPMLGEFYRMEFLVNRAEDVARVVGVNQTVVVAGGTFTGCVAIEESSPLETADVATKFYAPGVGLVLEIDEQTGGRLELIQVK